MKNCVFCKIANHEIAKEFTFEDSDVMVFSDIHPVKPVHLLIAPKKHYSDLLDIKDEKLLAKLMLTIQKMAKEEGLDKNGFRVLVNGGGAQAIMHLHIHLFGPLGQTSLL